MCGRKQRCVDFGGALQLFSLIGVAEIFRILEMKPIFIEIHGNLLYISRYISTKYLSILAQGAENPDYRDHVTRIGLISTSFELM